MDGGYCFYPYLFVCEQYYGKTQRISTKLGGGIRYGPRIMPLDFGLGPKSNMAAMAAILKKIFEFLFCISTFCFKWFPTKNKKKKNVGEKKKPSCFATFFSKKFRFYLKNIWIFFFAFLHVLSDLQHPFLSNVFIYHTFLYAPKKKCWRKEL